MTFFSMSFVLGFLGVFDNVDWSGKEFLKSKDGLSNIYTSVKNQIREQSRKRRNRARVRDHAQLTIASYSLYLKSAPSTPVVVFLE